MKKLNNLSESNFLKLFFAFVSLCFLIAAVCMPDRSNMFAGLWEIMKNPAKVSTNYFSIGGFAGTFLNMGLVAVIMTVLFCVTGATVNNVSTLAFLLTLGFCSWGINVLNMWPTMVGTALVALVSKQKLGAVVNAALFTTGVAPFISDMLVRYPGADIIGFNWLGLGFALIAGIIMGAIVIAGLPHSPNVHKGMNLYSAALPVGMGAFLLHGIFYKVPGIALPAPVGDIALSNAPAANIFCLVLFGLCVVLALLIGCTPKDYWNLLKNPNQVANVSGTCGNGVFLMNVGVFGLFILAYYNAIGANFNGVQFGLIFCMLCTCNSGSRPSNVWPIMAGYVVASFVAKYISMFLGGDFALPVNAAAICVGLCYANGLSPITDKYGWQYSFMGAMIHYALVTIVPQLHGAFCLYNGGFTAIFVCIILVPVLEKFCKTKEERKALKVNN
ncbi:MAG: DUF1576 domain-containing protein [Oscillospiraceae bacterium]|nr:DUF1576 domain-containing protein [Oscillospiraceae bacterium]